MKKLYLLSLLAMLFGITNAQITITNADLAPAGTTFYNSVDTDVPVDIVPGSPGPDKSWNFTKLSSDYVDTLVFMLPAWTPYPNNFPDANFAANLVDDGAYAFFIRNDEELSAIGLVGSYQGYDSMSVPLSPKEIYLDFPVQFGDSRDETFVLETTFASDTPPADSILFRQTTDKSTLVDAWGTLNLTIGSFETLRVRETKTVYDSVWAKIFGAWVPVDNSQTSSYEYKWITNDVNIGYYLVSMKYDTAAQIVGDVEFLNVTPVGINNEMSNDFIVYPNPASDYVNFSFDNDDSKKIEIYNINGQRLAKQTTSESQTVINISSFPKGIYIYSVYNKETLAVKRGKFIKN